MTVKPRTVDNLGSDVSIQYAKNQELLKDVRLIEESRWIPQKSEVSVTKPYIPSDFEQLFSSAKTAPWALFSAPPGYEAGGRALFSYQLVPSLGTYEKQEADTDRLAALEDALNKRQGRKKQQFQNNEDDEAEERHALTVLLQCIEKFDRTLALINARRNQYQRG